MRRSIELKVLLLPVEKFVRGSTEKPIYLATQCTQCLCGCVLVQSVVV